MTGTRGSWRRSVALGVLLGLSVLLVAVSKADAGKYEVAQCGWYVGIDASWADTTGGAKFRPDAWCAPPAGSDPFDGAHVKSFTKGGESTVSIELPAGEYEFYCPVSGHEQAGMKGTLTVK